MKTKSGLHLQVIVPALVLALLMNPFAYAQSQQAAPVPPADPQPQNEEAAHDASDIPPLPPEPNSDATSPAIDPLPDSPGAVRQQSAQLVPPMPAQNQPHPPQQQQTRPTEPVGTAVAETVPTMGVAASRPAGAALAPAKQRRVRTILIRMGAVLGAGAAVGLTMALSEGSPSKPPGAR